MGHEFESGFFARQGAWHGFGTVVASEQTWEDAQRLAGLEWLVNKLVTVIDNGAHEALTAILKAKQSGTADDLDRAIAEALKIGPKTKALSYAMQRSDNGRVIGSVGEQYTPFQNADAFKFMDEVVGKGLASFHTAGSLMGGRHVWCLCRLPGHLGSDIDPVEKYLLLATAHDGSKAVTVTLTPTRVVCWNTMSLAIGEFESGRSKGFRVRHNSNVFDKVTDAQRLIAEAEGTFDQFNEQITKMQGAKFSEDHFKMLCLMLYPPTKDAIASGKMDDVSTNRKNVWNDMLGLYSGGVGQQLATARGTVWGALNAVTEYVDHKRRSTAPSVERVVAGLPDGKRENRVSSVAWGSGAALKSQAFEILTEYVDKGTMPIPGVSDEAVAGLSESDRLARLEALANFN